MLLAYLIFILSISGIESVKFDFGIFENFVANAEIFTLERDIVHQLELTRKMLTKNADAIRSFNNKISGQKQLARDLTYQKSIQFNDKSSVIISVDLFNKSMTKDAEDIMSRASEGILLLQNTYTLKTDQLMRGVIRSHRDDVNPIPPIKMEGRESLQASIFKNSLLHFEQDC